MSTVLFLAITLAVLPGVMSSAVNLKFNGKPTSCLEVSDGFKSHRNGYYGLYDDKGRLFTTYCDLESDPGWAWTLIESLSLKNHHTKTYRKKFYLDVPSHQCAPDWSGFRLSKARMYSVKNARGSTYYRATCNFNPTNATGLSNHHNILRVALFRGGFIFDNIHQVWRCAIADYIDVRGYACRECNIPLYVDNTYHTMIDLEYAATSKCGGQYVVPDRWKHEYVFGEYTPPYTNSKFPCSKDLSSTTNWWIGGTLA